MTVPLLGWVAKRRIEDHPYDCGFKVSKYGAQQDTDYWDPDCGNGVYANGTDITGNKPADTSIAITPTFVQSWITHLVGLYGTSATGGVKYYNLDNEPMLWNSTHRDVHPKPANYDEMRTRTYQYAAAIKAADPSALTLGPVLWGWCAYFYSAADGCGIGADYQAHQNTPFVAWYLRQMKAYQQQHGLRILDYLDLHYYPQAQGVALSSAGGSSTQALRLRSTRSLWDPSYADESWIGSPVYLIPRMHAWVNQNYPSTKLAITEYNWGALDHINGALAQADVLGIFGREGLDIATLWGPPDAAQPGAFAFRMYRNYDGAGHGFGETGVQAASADQETLSVYAAQGSTNKALTVIVINKTAGGLTSSINMSGFTPAPKASVYRYSNASPGAIQHLADQPVTSKGFSAMFPGNSITLFVMSPGVVTVLSPNGGEVIPAGSLYNVSWSAPISAATFTIQYSSDNGTTWLPVAVKVTGTTYQWHVPSPASNKKTYRLKVIGYNSAGVIIGSDRSDASFEIEVVKIISPNGGETLTSGTPYSITWTTYGTAAAVANVYVQYSMDGGTSWKSAGKTTGNPGAISWTPPAVTQTQSLCKMRVILKDVDGNILGSDISNDVFTINPL
jgi:hypothetical protein